MTSVSERLLINNPWWVSAGLINEDSLLGEFEDQKFKYFHPLLLNFPTDKDAVLTLRGPRRVGKSTLMRLLIKRLLVSEKIPKEAVFFFPCDRVGDFNELFAIIKEYLDFARPRTDSRVFLFLDEISFAKDWQRAVKELVDGGRLKNATLLLTGSSILDLKFGSEFLAGRRGQVSPADIFYYPLDFGEFVRLVEPKIEIESSELKQVYYLPKLNKLFSDYLLTGGFPKTINEFYSLGRIENSTYETFLTWIENDLHKTKRSEQTAYDLLAQVFRTLTTQVSFTSLARDSGLAGHFAVQEYLDILEKMFILFPLSAFVVDQRKRDPKKNKKIFFYDPFIYNALYVKAHELMEDPFSASRQILLKQEALPKLAENAAAAHLKRIMPRLYWGKTVGGEVDFAGIKQSKTRFFEVKYQQVIDYRSVADVADLTVISKNTFKSKPVKTVPLAMFLSRLGKT